MKRSLFTKLQKGALLTVPAAALMLGAAQAQTTIGMNFAAWYYDSGATPQTIGYGRGYQTTGWLVTATAFGVPAANWYGTVSPDLLNANYVAIDSTYAFGPGGALNAELIAPGIWQTGIGEISPVAGKFLAGTTVSPGNDQVTWNYLESAGGVSPSVIIHGLSAKFPNGYAIQTIAAHDGVVNFNGVGFTDTITTTHADYTTTYYEANPVSDGYRIGGTIGLSGPSGTFPGTSDTIEIDCDPQTTGSNSVMSGFIITDVPVVTRNVPLNLLLATGGSFVLPAPCVVGISLTYQWQHAGTNLSGATFSTYTNNSAANTDSGLYQVVVTSTFFPSLPATNQVANVAVIPSHAARLATWDANTATTGAQDGSGIWSNTSTNWWSGSFNDYWGSADSAVFGAGGTGAYTVTLGDYITANSITFNSGAYTITNSSGQTLTLSGYPALTGATNGTITVPVTITTNFLLKLGAGKVTLAGALTSTNIIAGAGTLEVLAKGGGDAPYTVSNGATLKIGYSSGGGYANTGMKIYGDGAAATTGFYLKGGSVYSVSGTPTLLGAPTTIRQYGTGLAALDIFDINSTGLYCTAAASGSGIDANIQMLNGGYGMALQADAGANTATGDLNINGPLNIDAHNGVYGLVKRGTGSLRLNGVATPTNCGVSIRGGSVICGVNNCIGTNGLLNVQAGYTVDLNGTSQTVSNALLSGILKMTINKGGTPNCNQLNCWGQPASLGGTLVVTNVGGTLALGDTFTLFPVAGSGSFASLQLPTVGNGLAWQDNTAVNGTIQVVAGSVPPSIVTDLSGATNFSYAGVNQTFTVSASGDPTLHYVWLKNGTTRVGADSPILVLPSITTGSSAYYSCMVTNNYGTASSQTNFLSVVTPGLAVADIVQDVPGAVWPLNETTSPTAYDYSGAGNNGTQNGGLTLGVAGPQPPVDAGFSAGNTAYQFDGSSSFILCGTNCSFAGATDFTLEAWVNTTNNTSGEIIQQRSSSGYGGTANGYNGEYQLAVNANGTISFAVYGGGAYQFTFSSPVTSKYVNDGNWHHVAAVRSGTIGTIYIDGSAVASASGPTEAPLDSTIPTFIGFDQRNSANFFNGLLADVAIYSHALTAARIADHALKGVLGTSPLVIGEVAGGFIQDSKPSGTPHPGLNYGTIWLATSADTSITRTNVAQFPMGRQIVIPANADFNATNGTICFWMLVPTPPATGNGTMLFDRRTSSGTVMFVDSTSAINLQTYGGGNFSGGSVVDGNWHFVAYTYDQGSGGSQSLYVDGNLMASQPNAAAWSWPATQEIELGRSHDTYWQYYNGQMADFRIYSRILAAAEIGTIYSGNALVDTTTLKVRYNFNTAAGVGTSLTCPVGSLQNAPALAPASWTPVSNVDTLMPYLTPAGLPVTTNTTLFYRGGF